MQANDRIEGELTQIVYANEDDGYTVARVLPKGKAQTVTVVGNLFSVQAGETVLLQGAWVQHKRFGRQFRVASYALTAPATVEAIRRYLASGLLKGIGPAMAQRLTDRFGEQTLEIIEKDPQRLEEVEGIGPARIAQIRQQWDGQQEVRRIMLFLQGHGISPGLATKIFKHYGEQAVVKLNEDPYRLASEVFGIGFKTADRVATAMGVAHDSPRRVEAAILYLLGQAAGEGHVFLPAHTLTERTLQMLELDAEERVQEAIERLTATEQVFLELLIGPDPVWPESKSAVYLPAFYTAEQGIATRLTDFLLQHPPVPLMNPTEAVLQAERRLGMDLASEQRQAIERSLREKCLVITGGPGTGKTTLVRALVEIYRSLGLACLLAAPTGRAAKRLQEVTGQTAKTIHRLLEFNFRENRFARNGGNPLLADLVIVDEASMIDVVLMYHLVKALPLEGTLVLIGDVNQLPSVGPGSVLGDLIESRCIGVVRLSHIFRQAQESLIITNAHRLLLGKAPVCGQKIALDEQDFYFFEEEDLERAAACIQDLSAERIPQRFGFDSLRDIQVICPMHRGTLGTENLNTRLQERLNPSGPTFKRAGWAYRQNDKVMQVRNNYDKEVFNGDIGKIVFVDEENGEMVIRFEDRDLSYDAGDLDELIPAYAISVHKSQGMEYSAVILPLVTEHYLLLQRNLLYTAITRGKKLVVLVGTRKALSIAIRNTRTRHRYTLLKQRLARSAGE